MHEESERTDSRHAARAASHWSLLAGLGLSGLATGVFSFAYPLTAAGLSASPASQGGAALVGLAFSAYFLAKLAAAPAAGWLADRLDARSNTQRATAWITILACLTAALLPLLFLASRKAGLPHLGLMLVQTGLGLCAGAIRPLGLAMAASQDVGPGVGKSVGRRLARAALAGQAAFLLAPLLAGLLLTMGRTPSVLAFLSAAMLASALLFGLAQPRGPFRANNSGKSGETAGPHAPGKSIDPGAPIRPGGAGHARGPAGERFLSALRAVLADPLSARLLPAVAGRTLGTATLAAFLPMLLAASLPRDPLLIGLLFGLPNLAVCLGLPLTGRLADGPRAVRWAAVGLLASALGLLGLPLAQDSAWTVALVGLLMGLGSAVSLPASLGLAASGTAGRATAMAVYQSAASLGFVAGPLLGALAVRMLGGAEAALGLAGLCGVLCCLPLLARALPASARGPALAGTAALALTLAALPAQRALPPVAPALPAAEAANSKPEPHRYADLAMGTVVRLTLAAPNRDVADAAADKAFALIRELQADLDLRNPHGSVGRVNLNAGLTPERVSPEAFGVIERGLAWGRITHGAFDITIGAVSRAPGYWSLDPWYIRSRMDLVDYRRVVLDPAARTAYLPEAGMALDLGGLAKGAIIDAAVKLLRREGVSAGIVEAGGDMFCFGPRPWRVGVENPRGPGLLGALDLRERGVCGSGDYRRGAPGAAPGQGRRHHVLDPRGLAPASGGAAVTVVADSAETADALATALLVLGPERGRELLRGQPNAAALWIGADLARVASPGFPALSSP